MTFELWNNLNLIIMLWEKIKKILQKEGGKCIIIENNQPTYLVMKIEDYEKASEIEEVNQSLDELKAREGKENEEVKIEDLPF